MRRDKLNINELMKAFQGADTLGQLIRQAEDEYWKEGRVICEIHLNEILLSENEEQSHQNLELESIATIEFVTSEEKELVKENVQTLSDEIKNIIHLSENYVEKMFTGNLDENHVLFLEIVQRLDIVVNNLFVLKVKVCSDVTSENHRRWELAEVKLSSCIRQLLNSFESKNFSAMSDIIDYELLGIFDNWLEILSSSDILNE